MPKGCALGAESAKDAIEKRLHRLRAQAVPLRAETAQGIHDARVASRRLRAALKEFESLAPAAAKPFFSQVREVTRLLGRPRELDVMISLLDDRFAPPSPLHDVSALLSSALRERRAPHSKACQAAVSILESDAFSTAGESFLNALHPERKCLRVHLGERLPKRLDAAGSEFDRWLCKEENAQLHACRIACKKLRYACEIHQGHYGPFMEGFIRHLKSVQDCLGRWNDLRMLNEEIEALEKDAALPAHPEWDGLKQALHAEEMDEVTTARFTGVDFFAPDSRETARHLLAAPEVPCCLVEA